MSSMEQFKERMRAENEMKDTLQARIVTAVRQDEREEGIGIRDALASENALLRRSLVVLTTRIEELEAEIDTMRGELVEAVPDLERIAQTLRTFYFAPVSLSALEPLMALACELNPDIIEQRR